MSQATAPLEAPDGIRPVVRTGHSGNRSLWLFGAVLLLSGLLLFQALSARREKLAVPETRVVDTDGGAITAPAPLALPRNLGGQFDDAFPAFGTRFGPTVRVAPVQPIPPQVVTRVVQPSLSSLSPDDLVSMGLQRIQPPEPVPPPPVSIEAPQLSAAGQSLAAGERVSAGRLANPTLTVPKGTVIAAVLETALDSSRAGAARAIVSRDVGGFDGTRVLIPRGSRLYGEYSADVTSGQKRALVRWQRLTRPDGVIIDLDSPSADPLGRAGIAGKVDSHFFARFGSAILQSALDIGVGLATRSVADDTVIVGLPGSTQQITSQTQQAQVQPTLRVRQGTSVSVFVARDLDFSTVER